jgi:hypothetical protein
MPWTIMHQALMSVAGGATYQVVIPATDPDQTFSGRQRF